MVTLEAGQAWREPADQAPRQRAYALPRQYRKVRRPTLLRDLFVGTIVATATVRVVTSAAFEMHMFAAQPLINAAVYLVALLILIPSMIGLRRVALSQVTAFWLGAVAFAAGLALALAAILGNSPYYVLSWAVYISVGLLAAVAASRRDFPEMLAFSIRDNLLASVIIVNNLIFVVVGFVEPVADYALLALLIARTARSRWSRWEFALLAAFVLPHICSGLAIELSVTRAFVASLLAGLLLLTIYTRKVGWLLALAIVAGLGLSYLLSLDHRQVSALPRNIAEGVFLLKGDPVEEHISTAQRFYEADAVLADLRDHEPWSYVTGLGLGRTLDMSAAPDLAVTDVAMLGREEVNNIHFLPYAILHKFGALGLGLFAALLVYLGWALIADAWRGRFDRLRLFILLYAFGCIVYALPAANHFYTDPVLPMLLGGLPLTDRKRSARVRLSGGLSK